MEQYCALAPYTPDGKLPLWSSTPPPPHVPRASPGLGRATPMGTLAFVTLVTLVALAALSSRKR